MKNGEIISEALINNTIRLIGGYGFEYATTKAISHDGISLEGIKMNEVYIYRLFGSKEKLYAQAFAVLDNELFAFINQAVNDLESEKTFQDRMYVFFCRVWHFLIRNEDRCRCYVRYYYSAYFEGESLRNHRKLLADERKNFEPIFKKESDVISIIHTTFMTMMDFAIRVYNHDLEDNESNVKHIFYLLYNSLTPYYNPMFL